MKNFTNNFKQFTSRLSARWLIMALMLLVGTSSAWAYCASAYIATWDGSSNNQVKLYDGCTLLTGISSSYSDGITYEVGSTFGIDFYVITDHSTDYSNGKVYYRINEGTTQSGQLNRSGDYSGKRRYSFYLDIAATDATKLDVWITVPNSDDNWKLDNNRQYTFNFTRQSSGEDCTDDNSKIRIECERSYQPSIWAWDSDENFTEGNWPGVKMKAIDGETNAYYYEIQRGSNSASGTISIIFSNNGSSQSSNITGLKWGKKYRYDSSNNKILEECLPPACSDPTSVSISRGIPTTGKICQGSTIDLTANVDGGSGDITYVWEQTSGDSDWTIANASAQECTVTAGTGSATFKITATRCGTDINSTITLTADTKPALTLASPSSICTGTEIDLTEDYVTSKTGTVTWYSDANRSQEITNGIVTPINTGTSQTTNTYYAKVTNGVCSAKTDVSLSIKVDPQSAITLKAAPTICQGTTITFANYVNTSTGTVTWHTKSDFSDAAITTATPNQTTTYYAKATSGNCAPATASLKVTVDAKPILTLNSNPTICQGEQITLSEYVSESSGTVKWYSNSNRTTEITILTIAPASTTTYYARATNGVCSAVDKELTVTVASAPQTPSLSTNINMLNNTNKTATLTIGNYVEGVTYTLYKDNSSTGNTTTSTTFSVTAGGVYKVKGTNSNNPSGCQDTDFSEEITINVCPTPTKPQLTSTAVTTCDGGVTANGSITITNIAAYKDDTYNFKLGETPANPDANGNIVINSAANTEYTVTVTNSCGNSNSTEVEIAINDKTPTITASAAVTQPNVALTLNSAAGDATEWEVYTNPNEAGSITNSTGASVNFIATEIGEYVVKATNGDCSFNFTITVADAFYIWVRNAKEGETAYANFYYPDQNTEEYRGGEMFYAECTELPTNNTYTTYNDGGREADLVKNDCDGYTWYGFRASADVISGSKYFYVHAKNNINKAGWYTHTVPTKVNLINLTGDVYYTLCETNVNNCNEGSKGWKIVSVSAPYSGPVVHSLGSTTLGTDEFAALYVTDCSGKEITGYQWNKDGQPYSSVCSYVGKKGEENSNAGETNNIRPTVAGNYSCTVTYEGGTTATSAAVEIDGTYNRSFTSTIPVLVVNTGDEDFPGCQASGTNNYPSKYADELKAKRSVDVKIYDGEGALVYDRKARMAYRGSSSLNFTKKSYAFCPGKANCGDEDKGADYVKTEKLNMLGVGNAVDKDWVLYAAAADPSLMRNRMVFDTYQAMRNDWGVHSRYVELIVNGDYKGVYVFMDKITMNENRVEVNEDNGFIVKFDKTDCADRVEGYNGIFGDQKTFSTERTGRYGISTYHTTVDQLFEIEYPEKDDYPTGWANKVASIKEMFQAFEDALEAGDYATVQKYIDYDSWADWFIINEFTKNLDAYRASCIFVYTGEAGSKIEARPLWDQELSFNNAAANISGKGANSTSGLLIQNDGVYTDCFPAPFWFTGQLATFGNCGVNNGSGEIDDKLANCLLNDPCFVQVVKEKWNQHQFDALSAEKLNALVTKYTNELGDAALERESNKWPNNFRTSADCSAGSTGYNEVSHSDSKKAITSWIADGAGGRREGLTTAINGLTGASFSIQIVPSEVTTTPWEPVEIAVSVTPDGYDYKLEYTDNDLGSVANTIIEEEGDKITYRIPRPWPAGDEQQEGERTDIEYGIKATLNVQDGTTVCGSQAAPSSTAKIILQDEPNDECPQP